MLARYLQESGWARRLRQQDVLAAWEDVVGADIALHARAAGLRSGVLEVEVESSAWLHDLETFYKDGILAALKERVTSTRILNIRFRIARGRM